MSRRKVSTTIYLTEEQHARLRALSTSTRVAAAHYVREAIDAAIREGERAVAAGEVPVFTSPAPEPPKA